jgi:hypothetical protein
MSCDRYREAIVDHACGADITADAAAHMTVCHACSRMFDEQRRLVQGLDRELQRALAIEPSARFVAGALARVEYSSVRSRGVAWRGAAAAAAVLILVTLGSWRFVAPRPAERAALAALPAASPALVADRTPSRATEIARSGHSGPLPPARRRAERTKVPAPERRGPIGTEVIVPAEQSRAIERYLALVRRGALDTSALARPDSTGIAAPSDLIIAPLSVEALVVTDETGGVGPGIDRRELR